MNQHIAAGAGATPVVHDAPPGVASNILACRRLYRDGHGALSRCDGPMKLSSGGRAWGCEWCGYVVVGCYPSR